MESSGLSFAPRGLLVLLALVPCLLEASELRERTCCKYNTPSELCPDWKGCVLRDSEGDLSSPKLAVCMATDVKQSEQESCTPMEVAAPEPWDSERRLPFELEPYIFVNDAAKNLSGLEVRFLYSEEASRLRYRMFSTDVCPENAAEDVSGIEACRPRCVDLNLLGGTSLLLADGSEIVHDCEVGFYVVDGSYVRETVGHTYQMDWCMSSASEEESCHSFLFTMPPVSPRDLPPIVMLDKVALERERDVWRGKMGFPG